MIIYFLTYNLIDEIVYVEYFVIFFSKFCEKNNLFFKKLLPHHICLIDNYKKKEKLKAIQNATTELKEVFFNVLINKLYKL